MDGLLQAFGLGLGALLYVLVALAVLRGLRSLGRGSVAAYWQLRSRHEAEAQLQRVVELRRQRPEPRQRRAA